MVQFLLDQGMSPNTLGLGNDIPPLHAAVTGGNLRVIRLLLDHGADPVSRDDKGNTPFSVAMMLQKVDAATLISQYMMGNGSGTNDV